MPERREGKNSPKIWGPIIFHFQKSFLRATLIVFKDTEQPRRSGSSCFSLLRHAIHGAHSIDIGYAWCTISLHMFTVPEPCLLLTSKKIVLLLLAFDMPMVTRTQLYAWQHQDGSLRFVYWRKSRGSARQIFFFHKKEQTVEQEIWGDVVMKPPAVEWR